MRPIFLFIILFLTSPMNGQTPLITGENQKFIHYDEHAGLILTESLEPGMTLYRLSRKYNVSVEMILSYNPGLDPNTVPLGYPVNIPVNASKISFEPPPGEENKLWLSYRVQARETLYRIARIYLNVDPTIISSLNPSAHTGLQIGQTLHIGWLLSACPDPERINASIPDSIQIAPKDFIKEAHAEGQKVYVQKGLAVWKPGNVSSNYYVLHPTAKLGSYMEITNPMLHRTITAKVAGHIPPGLYQSHVGIVVSPSTARALGILDQQFFAHWRYVE